jgi:hypothetical protein
MSLENRVGLEGDDHRITLVVVGSGGVGKSCVTVRYLKDEFLEFYDPTVGESSLFLLSFSLSELKARLLRCVPWTVLPKLYARDMLLTRSCWKQQLKFMV